MKEAVSSVRKYQDLLIDERIKLWESGIRNQEEDLLDVLISLKDGNGNRIMSAQEVKAQIVVRLDLSFLKSLLPSKNMRSF